MRSAFWLDAAGDACGARKGRGEGASPDRPAPRLPKRRGREARRCRRAPLSAAYWNRGAVPRRRGRLGGATAAAHPAPHPRPAGRFSGAPRAAGAPATGAVMHGAVRRANGSRSASCRQLLAAHRPSPRRRSGGPDLRVYRPGSVAAHCALPRRPAPPRRPSFARASHLPRSRRVRRCCAQMSECVDGRGLSRDLCRIGVSRAREYPMHARDHYPPVRVCNSKPVGRKKSVLRVRRSDRARREAAPAGSSAGLPRATPGADAGWSTLRCLGSAAVPHAATHAGGAVQAGVGPVGAPAPRRQSSSWAAAPASQLASQLASLTDPLAASACPRRVPGRTTSTCSQSPGQQVQQPPHLRAASPQAPPAATRPAGGRAPAAPSPLLISTPPHPPRPSPPPRLTAPAPRPPSAGTRPRRPARPAAAAAAPPLAAAAPC